MQQHRLYMTYNESNTSKMPRELVRGGYDSSGGYQDRHVHI